MCGFSHVCTPLVSLRGSMGQIHMSEHVIAVAGLLLELDSPRICYLQHMHLLLPVALITRAEPAHPLHTSAFAYHKSRARTHVFCNVQVAQKAGRSTSTAAHL